ncbi:MAG TPA: hypothetical protein DCM87_14345 [Planctomycetes bacterium]|nr:hypothetical protein [Planctomycetota bacterium]
MRILGLVLREIRFRRLSFALGVLSVAVAVGCLAAELAHLGRYGAARQAQIDAKIDATEAAMRRLEDDYRVITKRMGFNVQIFPRGQSLAELHAAGHGTVFMPEERAETLARSRAVSVQHILPVLQQKTAWPERERTVILIGTRAEIPRGEGAAKQPVLDPVPAGAAVLGWCLHRDFGIARGDRIAFRGREFTVAACHEERGTADDISLWVNLAEAQEMLGLPGKISAILALSCQCEGAAIEGIRAEIAAILPDTQVIEYAFQAEARREARTRAARARSDAVGGEESFAEESRRTWEEFAAALVPVVAAACFVWIGVLALLNVRERRSEIGILRALGLHARDILAIFLARAGLVGAAGALLGYAGGIAALRAASPDGVPFFSAGIFAAAMLGAPALAMVVSWLPALMAARQDPAAVLREE